MRSPQKKKAPRPAPSPSYREIQLNILTELRLHTALMKILAKQGADAAKHCEIKAQAVVASAGRFV